MPIDNYKMSIQAKPLYGSIAKTDSEGGLVKIVRPLGRVRQPNTNSVLLNRRGSSLPRTTTKVPDDQFIHSEKSESVTGLSDDEMSRRATSGVARSESFLENVSLPQMPMSRSKVFENRYKIASRQNNDTVKPAKLYSKRVIYLPMFRVNVETYVGNTEDSKAVETTRQSLKRIIDHGKQLRTRSPSRMASAGIKSYNFVTPGKDTVNILEPATPRKLIQTDRSLISTSKTISTKQDNGEYDELEYFTKNGSVSDDADRMDVQFENLELNSVDDGMSGDLENLSTVSPRSKFHTNSSLNEMSEFVRKERKVPIHSLSDPYRNSNGEILLRPHKVGWPSFDDIKKMKQKIRWQKNARRQAEKDQLQNPLKPKSEVQRWVNIHYTNPKPILKHSSQPSVTKLDPIIVPSHTCIDCPMCNRELTQMSTMAPPNSPTGERVPLVLESSLSQRQNGENQFKSPTDLSMGKDSCMTSRSNQSSRNEVFMIPKVTVKVLDSKAQLEEAKMSYTKSNS